MSGAGHCLNTSASRLSPVVNPCCNRSKGRSDKVTSDSQVQVKRGPTMSIIGNTGTDVPSRYPRRDELRLILETALDAVVVMKPDGAVADWNDRAVDVFGWSREEAVGRIMADLIIPERYREAHRNGLRRYLESGKGEVVGRRIEVSGLRKNGKEFPLELSIAPIQDRENILFVGFVRDITELHALRLARAELARVTRNMAMGEMAASIAHEIKQPLTAIIANGNAGLRWLSNATPDIERAGALFKRIVNDTHHASEVIDSIRSMFKNESQAKTPQDLNEVIREALKLVRVEVENQRVSICTELSAELPQVPANQVQLRQVLVNLIVNAVDAMSTVENRAGSANKDRSTQTKWCADHRGGLWNRNRSKTFGSHLRHFLYDKVPRYGHGAVDLSVDHRRS
jgi:two-component system sensor kinase FixL